MNSLLEVVRQYRREVTALFANLERGEQRDLLRHRRQRDRATTSAAWLRSRPRPLAAYPRRLEISRTNPYLKPGGYLDVADGLQSFETRQCGSGVSAFLDPATPSDPDFNERFDGDAATAQLFFDRLQAFAFVDQLDTNAITPAPCNKQAPYESIGEPAETSDYLHVYPQP